MAKSTEAVAEKQERIQQQVARADRRHKTGKRSKPAGEEEMQEIRALRQAMDHQTIN